MMSREGFHNLVAGGAGAMVTIWVHSSTQNWLLAIPLGLVAIAGFNLANHILDRREQV